MCDQTQQLPKLGDPVDVQHRGTHFLACCIFGAPMILLHLKESGLNFCLEPQASARTCAHDWNFCRMEPMHTIVASIPLLVSPRPKHDCRNTKHGDFGLKVILVIILCVMLWYRCINRTFYSAWHAQGAQAGETRNFFEYRSVLHFWQQCLSTSMSLCGSKCQNMYIQEIDELLDVCE